MTEEFEKDMMHDLRAQGMILDEIVDLMNLSLVHFALSKFKDAALIPILEPYQESDQYLVRKEAKKAVKRLQKYQ